MDEDFTSMNDSLSYAEDVPYEAQLSDPTEQEGTVSLKKRIGQRIYLLEDSMAKKVSAKFLCVSKSSCTMMPLMKRKLADMEDNAEEEVAEGDAGRIYALQCQAAGVILSHPHLLFRSTVSSKCYSPARATYCTTSNCRHFRLCNTL